MGSTANLKTKLINILPHFKCKIKWRTRCQTFTFSTPTMRNIYLNLYLQKLPEW